MTKKLNESCSDKKMAENILTEGDPKLLKRKTENMNSKSTKISGIKEC